MKILDALRIKEGGDKLVDRLAQIRRQASYKLDHTRDLFPLFTDHTIRHSDGVLEILDWLMPDEIKDKLNAWELYFLVAATYLHDIGMVEGCPGTPTDEQWEKFYSDYKTKQHERGLNDPTGILLKAKREFVRAHHHERSEQYIRDDWRELELRSLETPCEADIVGRIALGHRKVDLSDRTKFGETAFGNNQLIRRDLLAAYLRLADELDTTAYRTPWAEYEVLDINDEVSALEWGKHLSLGGVADNQGVIILSGACYDHMVFLRLQRLRNDIKSKLDEMKRMLSRPYASGDGFYVADPLPYHDIELDIEHVGYLPIDIRFELQHDEIARLIMGERLYGDKTACIRELLQNAVDTCREARDVRSRSWRAKIQVKEEDAGKTLTVVDNGMAMDEYIVRQYFAKVGISYYRSKDFHANFSPISECGIGILSCFMMADVIIVDSKRDGSEPIQLEIRSLTESFIPRRGSSMEPGTTIRLHLKPDIIGKIDVLERVNHFAKHLEFPIEVITHDGTSYAVADEGLVPSVGDLTSLFAEPVPEYYSRNLRPDKIAKFHTTVQKDGTQLGVTLLERLIPSWRLRTQWRGDRKVLCASRLCQEGFLVGSFDEQFGKIVSEVWCELNLCGESTIPLTADRTRTAENTKEIWPDVIELCSEAIEKLYEKTEDEKTVQQWWRYHLSHYANRLQPIPVALRVRADQYADYCVLTSEGWCVRKIPEVKMWDGPLYWILYSDHDELGRVCKLLPKDSAIVVLPPAGYGRYVADQDWWWELIGRSDMKAAEQLFEDLGVKFHRTRIDGRWRVFLDAGTFLGRWRMPYSWILLGSPHRATVFDAHHPFSRVLLQYCTGKLPRKDSLVVAELFRLAHTYTDEDLAKHQTEAIGTLKEGGIVPAELTYSPVEERGVRSHDCPYPNHGSV